MVSVEVDARPGLESRTVQVVEWQCLGVMNDIGFSLWTICDIVWLTMERNKQSQWDVRTSAE